MSCGEKRLRVGCLQRLRNHPFISDGNCSLFLEQTALQCSRESTHLMVDYLSFVKKIIMLGAMRFTQSKERESFCLIFSTIEA